MYNVEVNITDVTLASVSSEALACLQGMLSAIGGDLCVASEPVCTVFTEFRSATTSHPGQQDGLLGWRISAGAVLHTNSRANVTHRGFHLLALGCVRTWLCFHAFIYLITQYIYVALQDSLCCFLLCRGIVVKSTACLWLWSECIARSR